MNNNLNPMSILMLPWLAHGHISPFLQLSKRLSDRGITVYFCSTSVNLVAVERRLAGTDYSSKIRLVHLCLPDSPDLPPHLHTTANLPPHLMPALKAAFDLSSPAFTDILSRLRPRLVICDFLQPWAFSVASSLGIPAVIFYSSSAAMCAFARRMTTDLHNPFPELYLRNHEQHAFVQQSEGNVNGIKEGDRSERCIESSAGLILIKTCREIEAKYIDDIALQTGKKVVPVGSLVEEHNQDDTDGKIIKWLAKKTESSTVYASFGSEYFPTPQEITEIAHGLEQSDVNFIWAIRLSPGVKDCYSLRDALPEGFSERVKDRGCVTEDWVPQAAILKHPSTGGFLSHCGWGSVMEALHFGVPIIAMPMHLDQPINARLVAEGIGVGLEVERGRDGKVRWEEVARTVRKVMLEAGGEKVRRRAKELSAVMGPRRDDEYINKAVEELLRVQLVQSLQENC